MQAVVTDVPKCGGAEFAQSQNAKVLMFPPKDSSFQVPEGVTVLASEEELTDVLLDMLKIDFVVLAGYLKLVPASTVTAFSRRMLNIHPSLLPAFGGKGMFGGKVHSAVIASGCRCVLLEALVHCRTLRFSAAFLWVGRQEIYLWEALICRLLPCSRNVGL